jgi:heme-degrading monooxygenase HmoA
MAVKVMMRRVPKRGAFQKANNYLRQLRILAMSQPGYISGETLLSASEQGTTLVISIWASLKHWKDYENSSKRRELLDQLEPLLEEPPNTEVWVESPVVG